MNAALDKPEGGRGDTPAALRRRIRAGRLAQPTAGLAPGYVQCNVLIVPARFAEEFADFCAANEAACPVLARSAPGDPTLPTLGADPNPPVEPWATPIAIAERHGQHETISLLKKAI